MSVLKIIPLTRHNIHSYSNITIGTDNIGTNWCETVRQMNDNDSLVTIDDWYGDRCIGSLGSVYIYQQQWIFSCSWGDGFAIRKINDDGSITRVYGVSHGNGYNHHTGIAVHEGTGKVFVNQYNTPRMGIIDIQPWIDAGHPDDGSGITQTNNIYMGDAPYNFPTDRTGTSYENGLKLAGDWLYMASYARNNVNGGVWRWNVRTYESQLIDIANNTYNSSNWEGSFVYDETNDKLFYQVRWNGGLNIIENASTDNPTAFRIHHPSGNQHCTYKGIVYIDGNPNRILTGGDWRYFEYDISECGPENQTPVKIREQYGRNNDSPFNNYMWFGSEDPYMIDEYKGGNSTYRHNWIPVHSDRGWNRKGAWFDLEEFKMVGRNGENDYSHQRDTVFSDYQGGTFKVTSAGGNDYWIYAGYSWDGNRIRVYSAPWLFETSAEIVFGNGSANRRFDDNAAIAAVDLDQAGWDKYVPSGCVLSISVSNNNGSTWETYSGGIHTFSSTGIDLKARYTFSNQENKSVYMKRVGGSPSAIIFKDGFESVQGSKALNYKIAGI